MKALTAALALVGAAGLLLGTPHVQPAHAADTEWKMHLVWVPTRQEVVSANKFVERVNARTGDKFKITAYTGGSLGVKDSDMLRILPPGNVIQITMLYTGYVARDAPDLAFALPEGVLSSAEDVVKALPVLDDIYEEGFQSWGVKYLGTLISPDKSINIYCKDEVNTLEELRTKKLRVWSKALLDSFAKIGVSGTIIPQNDMYIALQTGVVDCATYYPGAANTLSLQEVAPNWAFLSHYAVPIPLVVSQKAWDALPADVQAVMTEEADKLVKELADNFLAGNYEVAEGKKFDAAGGKQLEPFPEADQAAFTAAAVEVWEENATQLGGKLEANRKRLADVLGN
ncbi:MAG: TRAP transporter substrate-binding protein DctP [Alphaproteobacteria bacterium]|nr:TRAP transporter substrate-binding protein DctP [Alphaproteobacteria bacterium]MDX5368960.1 TRAP transporter substrate-binding protein DctP [Alphaproteobacteria bacterium]